MARLGMETNAALNDEERLIIERAALLLTQAMSAPDALNRAAVRAQWSAVVEQPLRQLLIRHGSQVFVAIDDHGKKVRFRLRVDLLGQIFAAEEPD